MNLVVDQQPDGIVVIGWSEPVDLDASNVEEFRRRVHEIERDQNRIVIDMTQVEFIDSSSIGALVGFLRRARAAGGDVKLAGLSPDIETIFELTRLQRVFRIHPELSAALKDFENPVA